MQMTVDEIRKLTKTASRDQLEAVFLETYKRFPRGRKREDLESLILPILRGTVSVAKPKQKPKPVSTETRIDDLEQRYHLFAGNARAGNYYYDNDFVPKEDRSRWRYLVLGFVKELDRIQPEDADGPRAAAIWLDLYLLLSHGTIENLFRGNNPFRSIGISQEEFVARMTTVCLSVDFSQEKLREVLKAIGYSGFTMDTLSSSVREAAISCLPEARLKAALDLTKELSEEQLKRISQIHPLSCTADDLVEKYAAEHLVEMVLEIASAISPETFQTELDFYYRNAKLSAYPENILYKVLSIVDRLDRREKYGLDPDAKNRLWISVYEDGLKRNISPRDELKKKYRKLTGN